MVENATGPLTLDGMVERVRGLATLPDVYLRIKRILDDPTSAHADVADALKTDPAMAARLLRVANSAFYGRPSSITTIERAVGLLGTQQVHDLVLAAAVIHSFDGLFPPALKPRDFWRTSILAATTSKLLGDHCGFLDAERLFVAGLLAQVGQLVLLEQLPVQMGSIMYQATHSAQRASDLQRESLGFDYAEVGAALFAAWQLPRALAEPILLHTRPAAADDFALESAILHIAVEAANAAIRDEPLVLTLERLDAAAWQLTGLSQELFEQIRSNARDTAGELIAALLDRAA
jgi:HD-like signal output (HDOD) protein